MKASKAYDYLKKNDPDLTASLKVAEFYQYSLENLNIVKLANIHKNFFTSSEVKTPEEQWSL